MKTNFFSRQRERDSESSVPLRPSVPLAKRLNRNALTVAAGSSTLARIAAPASIPGGAHELGSARRVCAAWTRERIEFLVGHDRRGTATQPRRLYPAGSRPPSTRYHRSPEQSGCVSSHRRKNLWN